MSSGFMVVAMDKDRVVKGDLQGNVDMAFVSQDAVIVFPV